MSKYAIRWDLLTDLERDVLTQLGVPVGTPETASSLVFQRQLGYREMVIVGMIIGDLGRRTPGRPSNNHINFAFGDWLIRAEEWLGEGVGIELGRRLFSPRRRRAATHASADTNAAIKRDMINAFFKDFEKRVRFVKRLIRDGRETEAIILSCVYIEGLGNNLYPDCSESMRNFVRVIQERGNVERLSWIHPRWLLEALPQRSKVAKAAMQELRSLDLPPTVLLTEEETVAACSLKLSGEQVAWLKNELWRGTLAGIVYAHMRSVAVKRGLASNLILGECTRDGKPVAVLDVSMLHQVLETIVKAVHQLSLETGKRFGTDPNKDA